MAGTDWVVEMRKGPVDVMRMIPHDRFIDVTSFQLQWYCVLSCLAKDAVINGAQKVHVG